MKRVPSRSVNTPIIAFSKDWHEDPTSNHHVLRELAETRRVLWLNSIATRTPQLTSRRDVGKIARKVREFARGPVNVENDLWVMSPLALPLPHNEVAKAVNQRMLRGTIRLLRARLGIDRFHLWTFLPTTASYVGTLGEEAAIYYCVDDWSRFTYVDGDAVLAEESVQLAKVDAVFATNNALADVKRRLNPQTYFSPHGVDHALFASALDAATVVPPDLAAIPSPRIGFFGTLQDWVDYELVAHVARKRPDWHLVLIGQQLTEISEFEGLANVHLLGQRPQAELPAYCKGFDVGIIPYRIDERIACVNPLKLREYLAAGLPVVSTPIPDLPVIADQPHLAASQEAFVDAIERALDETAPAARAERSLALRDATWSARVADVARIVDEVVARKNGR